MKKALVIDSSVAVKWLNSQNEEYVEQSDKILQDAQKGSATLIMPELAKYEIGNALLNKQMSLPNTLGSLSTIYSVPIQFVPQDSQQALGAARIAFENKVTFYDAVFMALAKEQKATLVTENSKHQNKKVVGLKVVKLQDYK